MKFTFVIEGRLPGINEILNAMSTRKGAWNQWHDIKKEYENIVIEAIEKAGKPEQMFWKPVKIDCHFYEKNAKRDVDNVSGGGHKIIFDALQKAEVIKQDSQKYVKGHSDLVEVDPAKPRIVVTVYDEDEEKSFFKRIEEIPARDTDWE